MAFSTTEFRNCFEAGMDFDTALGCSGLSEADPDDKQALRDLWAEWEAAFNA